MAGIDEPIRLIPPVRVTTPERANGGVGLRGPAVKLLVVKLVDRLMPRVLGLGGGQAQLQPIRKAKIGFRF